MAQCLIEEDAQQEQTPSMMSATPKLADVARITPILPNHTVMVPAAGFPGGQLAGSSCDNPVHLSDANDASTSGLHPIRDADMEDDAAVLGHFSDTLTEMATSIVGLKDGYFRALHEVIVETEKACGTCCVLMRITSVV